MNVFGKPMTCTRLGGMNAALQIAAARAARVRSRRVLLAQASLANSPVLSPSCCVLISMRFSMDSHRLFSGVSFG